MYDGMMERTHDRVHGWMAVMGGLYGRRGIRGWMDVGKMCQVLVGING